MDAQIPDEKPDEAGGHSQPRCMNIVTKNFSDGLRIKPRFVISSKKKALHLKNASSYQVQKSPSGSQSRKHLLSPPRSPPTIEEAPNGEQRKSRARYRQKSQYLDQYNNLEDESQDFLTAYK